MFELLVQKFDTHIASHIFKFMDHPTALLINDYFQVIYQSQYYDKYNWNKWRHVIGYTLNPEIGNNKHYFQSDGTRDRNSYYRSSMVLLD